MTRLLIFFALLICMHFYQEGESIKIDRPDLRDKQRESIKLICKYCKVIHEL